MDQSQYHVEKKDLLERAKKHCKLMLPQPTDLAERLVPLEKVRAVIFDVYGTMLISGIGDISAGSTEDAHALNEALIASGIEIKDQRVGHDGVDLLNKEIESDHARKRVVGIDFPEVDIRSIWRRVLIGLAETGAIVGPTSSATTDILSIEYECRVNPVWSMPGILETLQKLVDRGLSLGIISNSQFYTPLLIEALLGDSPAAMGFADRLCAWSYEMGYAKPSMQLFRPVVDHLLELGIEPHQVLYVGNDLRKDVGPAHQLGCLTALFAGDRRSLRLERSSDDSLTVEPTTIIRDLSRVVSMVDGLK